MSQQRRCKRGHDPYLDQWHRRESVNRFLDGNRAQWLTMIDVDACEYCHLGGCLEPVALIETKLIWSREKTMTVTANLARRASLPVFLVEYETLKPSESCETCEQPVAVEGNDIAYFVITGDGAPQDELSPQAYAEWLWRLRLGHWRDGCVNPAAARMLAWKVEP